MVGAQIVVSMAVATWYFTRDKGSEIGNKTVLGAISTSLFYHAGTAAFGSLIIAIIKTIRAIVTYIQKKTRGSQNKVLQVNNAGTIIAHGKYWTIQIVLVYPARSSKELGGKMATGSPNPPTISGKSVHDEGVNVSGWISDYRESANSRENVAGDSRM